MSPRLKSPPIVTRAATSNRLLAALASEDLALLAPDLESVVLPVKEVLYEPGETIDHVYFPTVGCVSLINATLDGSVEVGTIGLEGMVGVAVLLRGESEPTRTLVQVQGEAYRLSTAACMAAVAQSPAIERVFLRYTLALFNQVAQSVACNRLHSLEERCARWLLITHDRVDGDQFKLTQEFLSYMLGVHRPAVTLAAGILQTAGYIRYSRGTITVTDRKGLESACCGCYRTTLNDYASLMG